MKRLLAAGTSILLVLLGTGCALPDPGISRAIEPTAVPYALLSPAPAEQPPPELNGQEKTTPRMYLVNAEDRLVPVPVTLDATGLEAVVRQLLDQLDNGPSESQRQQGLSSALSPQTALQLRQMRGRTADVSITFPGKDPSADRLPFAIGQVVLSLTSVAGVERVQMFRDGAALELALPGGARTSQPVTAQDYASLTEAQQPAPKADPAPSASQESPPQPSPTPDPARTSDS
ncbi:MAG TPA: GerMN domain-containing protein [Actinomycetales bacterium]|nr:GerMN domain-containing protein [Actinomycetales bacterium]